MTTLINIDNGGTQTDICVLRDEQVFRAKALTTPYDLSECFINVLKAGANEVFSNGQAADPEEAFDRLLQDTTHLRYSTTEGTNRIVQQDGPRLGLIVNTGTNPQAALGAGDHKPLFDVIVGDRVGEVDANSDDETLEEQVVAAINGLLAQGASRLVVALSEGDARQDESRLFDIILKRYPRHLLGAVPVLFSHEIASDENTDRRTWTALLNAFLHPAVEEFLYQADRTLRRQHVRQPMLIYCNDGTTKRVAKTVAMKTVDSGPRGGLEGARALARHYGLDRLIMLDVGGTTADISLVEPEAAPQKRRGEIHGIPISMPMPDVATVGVAGSSVFSVDEAGNLSVGPRSVGSTPGPACFARGGTEATQTDVNLLLGLLDADSYFGGQLRLDAARAEQAVKTHVAAPLGITVDEALPRMVDCFETAIAEGVEAQFGTSQDATLLAFGGAGPMNACGIAECLGAEQVLVPSLSAVFSAFGMGFSDIAHIYEIPLEQVDAGALQTAAEQLREQAANGMFAEGYALEECSQAFTLEYDRAGTEIAQPVENMASPPDVPDGAASVALSLEVHKPIPGSKLAALNPDRNRYQPEASDHRQLRLASGERREAPLYRIEDLECGAAAPGPAVIEEKFFTCRVPDGWAFVVDENRNLTLSKE